MKSNRTHTAPPIIENLGDGTSYYNFDIEESQRIEGEDIEVTNFDYNQVTVKNPVTKSKIKDRILEEGYDLELLEAGVDALDNIE